MELVKKIIELGEYRKTYRVGLLQDRAYRILKKETGNILNKYGISTIEWAYIGLIHDNPSGIRLNTAASILGVTAPFITGISIHLCESKKLITIETDGQDKRAKIACLSPAGKELVNTIELDLREQTKPLLRNISKRHLIGYITVLGMIIKNSEM